MRYCEPPGAVVASCKCKAACGRELPTRRRLTGRQRWREETDSARPPSVCWLASHMTGDIHAGTLLSSLSTCLPASWLSPVVMRVRYEVNRESQQQQKKWLWERERQLNRERERERCGRVMLLFQSGKMLPVYFCSTHLIQVCVCVGGGGGRGGEGLSEHVCVGGWGGVCVCVCDFAVYMQMSMSECVRL